MSLRNAIQSTGLLAALLASPVRVAPAQADRTAVPLPEALVAAGESAEDLYDAAKAEKWDAADRQLKALNEAAARLRPDGHSGSGTAHGLVEEIQVLDCSVPRRQRHATMEQANQVTLTVADMTEPYSPRVPAAVARLDYYGRELQIWSEAGATDRLKRVTVGMRHEWDTVRPAMAARAPEVARTFESLVARVERAESPAEYAHLAGPVLDEVDELEQAAAASL
jgi:hypothetical protein